MQDDAPANSSLVFGCVLLIVWYAISAEGFIDQCSLHVAYSHRCRSAEEFQC